MQRSELLTNLKETLTRAGFYTADLCTMRCTGFDIIARRDNTLLIVKVLSNIDSLNEHLATELLTLSRLLNGKALLIGEKNGCGSLEDEVIYYRFGVQAVTLPTFTNHLLEGMPLHVFAAPGGFYVYLDANRLKRLRTQKNLSLGTFARHVNISRRAVQMYEEGMNARIDIAIRIEDLLDDVITTPIELLQQAKEAESPQSPTSEKDLLKHLEGFQQEVLLFLHQLGYKITPLERCPFEAVSSDKKKQALLTSVHPFNERLIKRAHIMTSISKISEKPAIVITDKETSKRNLHGTPLISRKELKKTKDAEDLLDLIFECL